MIILLQLKHIIPSRNLISHVIFKENQTLICKHQQET